jgi:ankyrin repeat domain-containing protein 50
MDSLVTKLTPKAVLKALETLPTETDTTYEKAMQRINDMNPDFREKAKLFLMWVAYTYRPLNIREIEHATTLLPDETEIDTDEIVPAKVLASMCAGLVIIDEMENVRLCHYTVENYFKKVRGEVFVNTDVCLSRTCLTYLLLDEFRDGRCADRDFKQRSKKYPLLGYASSNWGRHAVEATDPSIDQQVLVFLKSDPHRDAATQAIWHLEAAGYKNWDAKSGASGLHWASYFGLIKAVESLIADQADVDAQDSLGTTPLIYASLQGHETIVQKLLDAGANPNIMCSRGGTALHRAAAQDYLAIVKLLLAHKDIDVNALYSSWGHESALQLAAEYGYADVVKELLGRADIRVNEIGGGYTALHLAVQYEQTEVIRLLLADPRIDLEVRNQGGWPALVCAARFGYNPIIEMLLDAGAPIEQSDSALDGGGTAILRAIDYNKLATVQLLYSRNANWDARDKYNRSLLHGAAVNDRSQILHWLLATQPAFDINLQDVNGKTALHDAAFLGYDDCIKILLDFHARTDIRDRAGKTPLRTAKEHNNISAYALLQAARDDEIKSLQRSGTLVEVIEMPLCTAALIGDRERVKVLIERAKRTPDSSKETLNQTDDGLERSALAAAVEGGHVDIVDLLLAAGVDVNLQDRLGRTPLHGCALYNRYAIAQKLIDAHADIDRPDQWGKSALSMAQSYGRRALVVLFLEYGAKIDEQEQNVQTLLFQAAYLGNEKVVKRLLGMGADAQRKDGEGLTPLGLARLGGHEETAALLLEWEAKGR